MLFLAIPLTCCFILAFKTKVPNGIECYACIGPSNEDCSVDNAEKVKCYGEGSQCLNGTRTVQLGKREASEPLRKSRSFLADHLPLGVTQSALIIIEPIRS